MENDLRELHYELVEAKEALRKIGKLAKAIGKLTAGNPAVQILLDLIQDEIAFS